MIQIRIILGYFASEVLTEFTILKRVVGWFTKNVLSIETKYVPTILKTACLGYYKDTGQINRRIATNY